MDILKSDYGLKNAWNHAFHVGAAVSRKELTNPKAAKLVETHFSSITAENAMKLPMIQPEEGKFDWQEADFIADFARERKLPVRGHNFIWHSDNPSWLFDFCDCHNPRKTLYSRLEKHITSVIERYKDIAYSWDVTNEIFDLENGDDQGFRNSPWIKAAGTEIYEEAFRMAHRIDPKAKLFLNDHNLEEPEKREKTLSYISRLLDKGVPIHGIGIQGHWDYQRPSHEDLRKAIESFTDLGLEIEITELDISLYCYDERELMLKEIPEDRAEQQMLRYQSIFRIAADYPSVKGISTWGIADNHTWLDHYPVRGRKNWPLLFDKDFKEKSIIPILIDTGFNLQS